jgi:hypothetical protein
VIIVLLAPGCDGGSGIRGSREGIVFKLFHQIAGYKILAIYKTLHEEKEFRGKKENLFNQRNGITIQRAECSMTEAPGLYTCADPLHRHTWTEWSLLAFAKPLLGLVRLQKPLPSPFLSSRNEVTLLRSIVTNRRQPVDYCSTFLIILSPVQSIHAIFHRRRHVTKPDQHGRMLGITLQGLYQPFHIIYWHMEEKLSRICRCCCRRISMPSIILVGVTIV